MSTHTRPLLSLILNTPPQAQVGSVSNGIQSPLRLALRSPRRLASIRIEIAETVIQLALCLVVKSVIWLAFFFTALCGRLALRGSVLRGFVERHGCGFYALLHRFFGTPPQTWQIKDRQSRSVMNCHDLSAPKALVKMSAV